MKDDLGDRMKRYEAVTKQLLPRRTYTIIRVDGKAFHTYTKGLNRPIDEPLVEDMNATAIHMCKVIDGAQFAYVQSDEISVLLSDFNSITSEAWFGGNVQKLCSISASTATWMFNRCREMRHLSGEGSKVALFDSRVFTIPDPTEVSNYFIWRQKDATRNSISSAAQYLFSHKELQALNVNELQEKMWKERHVNWNDYPVSFKRGRLIKKVPYQKYVEFTGETVSATKWEVTDPDIWTQSNQLKELIPTYG